MQLVNKQIDEQQWQRALFHVVEQVKPQVWGCVNDSVLNHISDKIHEQIYEQINQNEAS